MSHTLVAALMSARTGSAISKLVLLKLADNADAQGRCFPSIRYLSQYCEVSIRTVNQHLHRLEDLGFIRRIKRFDQRGRQRSNQYQLLLRPELHVELDNVRHNDLSCTGEAAATALTEEAVTAPIINHKEKRQEGSCLHVEVTPAETRTVDKRVAEFARRNANHPYKQRIADLIKSKNTPV